MIRLQRLKYFSEIFKGSIKYLLEDGSDGKNPKGTKEGRERS